MADTDKTEGKKGPKADKAPKGDKDPRAAKGEAAAKPAKGEAAAKPAKAKAAEPPVTARLRSVYQNEVRKKLTEKFGYKSPMQVPGLDKVVLNIGVGEGVNDRKKVET